MGFIKSDFVSFFFFVDFKIIVITHLAEGWYLIFIESIRVYLKITSFYLRKKLEQCRFEQEKTFL